MLDNEGESDVALALDTQSFEGNCGVSAPSGGGHIGHRRGSVPCPVADSVFILWKGPTRGRGLNKKLEF